MGLMQHGDAKMVRPFWTHSLARSHHSKDLQQAPLSLIHGILHRPYPLSLISIMVVAASLSMTRLAQLKL